MKATSQNLQLKLEHVTRGLKLPMKEGMSNQLLLLEENLQEMENKKMEKVLGDADRFRQVLSSLILNSIKFTRVGSITVLISYSNEHSSIVVHVVDTGKGIE